LEGRKGKKKKERKRERKKETDRKRMSHPLDLFLFLLITEQTLEVALEPRDTDVWQMACHLHFKSIKAEILQSVTCCR
jgi:hypothetical protein